MYVETFALTQESLRIQTSNSNSQPIGLEVAVHISKFLRKGFSIIKMYHSQYNSLHQSNVRSLTRSE